MKLSMLRNFCFQVQKMRAIDRWKPMREVSSLRDLWERTLQSSAPDACGVRVGVRKSWPYLEIAFGGIILLLFVHVIFYFANNYSGM